MISNLKPARIFRDLERAFLHPPRNRAGRSLGVAGGWPSLEPLMTPMLLSRSGMMNPTLHETTMLVPEIDVTEVSV